MDPYCYTPPQNHSPKRKPGLLAKWLRDHPEFLPPAIAAILLLSTVLFVAYYPDTSTGPASKTRVMEVLGANSEGYQNMYTYWLVRLEDRPETIKAYYRGASLAAGDEIEIRDRRGGGINIVGFERPQKEGRNDQPRELIPHTSEQRIKVIPDGP
jgi:hypothetical protein